MLCSVDLSMKTFYNLGTRASKSEVELRTGWVGITIKQW